MPEPTKINEQDFEFDQDALQPVNQTKKKKETEVTPKPDVTPPKPKNDSNLKPGDVIQLKSTTLYYFINGKFVEAEEKGMIWKWRAPDSTRIEYISTSTTNKNWIFIKIKNKKFWAPLDKVIK
jgi:hypothetical protein